MNSNILWWARSPLYKNIINYHKQQLYAFDLITLWKLKTHGQTDIVTTRPTRPRGSSWWKTRPCQIRVGHSISFCLRWYWTEPPVGQFLPRLFVEQPRIHQQQPRWPGRCDDNFPCAFSYRKIMIIFPTYGPIRNNLVQTICWPNICTLFSE